MTEREALARAGEVFDTIEKVLQERRCACYISKPILKIYLTVHGDDFDFPILFKFAMDCGLLAAFGMLPFKVPEKKRKDFAVAVCAANWELADGCFNLELEGEGQIYFKTTANYINTNLSKEVIEHIIDLTAAAVNIYGGKFRKVIKTDMPVERIPDYINPEF